MNHVELLTATVGHERLTPRNNKFSYSVYYVITPVTDDGVVVPSLFSVGRFNVLSIHPRDYGPRDGSSLRRWIVGQCAAREIKVALDDEVLLISHPRLFGFAFNPISYWLVYEKSQYLKAVVCEVHNTFGDTHNYLLAHPDQRGILPSDVFHATKNLYVSPFNVVPDGAYTFSFTATREKFSSSITYFHAGVRTVTTYMGGTRTLLTPSRILSCVIGYPAMTLLVVVRIHWQAVRLYFKGVPHTLAGRPAHTQGNTTQGVSASPQSGD
jgi:DUF1365 family protein